MDSIIYRDQILLGPLQQFWEKFFGDDESLDCKLLIIEVSDISRYLLSFLPSLFYHRVSRIVSEKER